MPTDNCARSTLDRELRRVEIDIASGDGKILRLLDGGLPWTDERVRVARSALREAMANRGVLRDLLRALDEFDALITKSHAPALLDHMFERTFVAALIARPEIYAAMPPEVGLDVLGDMHAAHAFCALSNLYARGEAVTPAAVVAEVERTCGVMSSASIAVAELVKITISEDAPIMGWARSIVQLARRRREAVARGESKSPTSENDGDLPESAKSSTDEDVRDLAPTLADAGIDRRARRAGR